MLGRGQGVEELSKKEKELDCWGEGGVWGLNGNGKNQ